MEGVGIGGGGILLFKRGGVLLVLEGCVELVDQWKEVGVGSSLSLSCPDGLERCNEVIFCRGYGVSLSGRTVSVH